MEIFPALVRDVHAIVLLPRNSSHHAAMEFYSDCYVPARIDSKKVACTYAHAHASRERERES